MSNKSKLLAKEIRSDSLRMVHQAKASHIASGLSIVDIIAVLYSEVLEYDPSNPGWLLRDRFILSKGHACVPLYSALARAGYYSIDRLMEYGEINSDFMHHISSKVPGVEFSTGSLGHGLPFALGKAIQLKHSLGSAAPTVFVLLGDGELAEGSNWEALLIAAHHKINNLKIILDNNNLQSFKSVDETLSLGNIRLKVESFGFEYVEIDGHDHFCLYETLKYKSVKPMFINCKTIKGKGVSFMENEVRWHYANPNDEELERALKEILDEK
jgi:transketolase